MGAVATTFMAGVEAVRRGLAKPIGSLTQMGAIRLGKRTENRSPLIRDLVPLAKLDDMVFAGWDLFPDDAYQAASKAGVLTKEHLAQSKEFLSGIKPMTAVFEQSYVKRLTATHAKKGTSKMDLAEQVVADIEGFRKAQNLDRLVMVWCGSTEAYHEVAPVHASLASFEKGLQKSDPEIAPSQIYAYAALKCGVPYANGAPNLSVDAPAMVELAKRHEMPIAGKDFKTGQTFMKTIIAPGLKARMLGICAAGTRPTSSATATGRSLTTPGPSRPRRSQARRPRAHPGALPLPRPLRQHHHKVRIDYYPPRGDAKEGWDNIDIVGWMGYPMQIKINFLCRDSILAAPVVLDLASSWTWPSAPVCQGYRNGCPST